MSKPLTDSILFRLTGEALASFLGQAERFELAMRPGCCLALSNEPVADLNYVVAGRGAGDTDHFAEACRTSISRSIPFLAMIFPGAGRAPEKTVEDLGLVFAVEFPMMVRDDRPIEPSGNEAVVVRRASGADGAEGNARVLGSAFNMPPDSVRRVMPASLTESPNVDVFLASVDDEIAGAVTVTYHGDTAGIWAMGTDRSRQKGGIGRRLLSTAMAEALTEGARRFFLGATPAGYRLYESLGYTTRCTTKVWAWGETHQA